MDTKDLTGLEIAVIGQAGRFPGAKNLEEFWENIKNGIASITFFSDQELREQGIDEQLLQDPNYIKARGVLAGIEHFDHDFFGYSYGEAYMMDPQLRVLHECSWEALENAGYHPEDHQGLIGVYTAGEFSFDWLNKFLSNQESSAEQMHVRLLNNPGAMSTRLSYNFNLKGPSYTVNTACSSSLVAIHVACQALLNYECDLALAGGVGINLPNKSGYPYQKGMITSPDGHCRAFDEQAAGIVPGNGCGIVVLKRLEDAIEAGDHIAAVVKGSAINNDGLRKAGYTAPSIEGQGEVISMAQQIAEVPAESISYIEAHGTATALGDPIEIEGLKLGFNTEKRQYCRLGSVKTNIGHLDTAAGVAGFIKTVLSLKNQLIVPSLNFHKPNPKINFADSPFLVNQQLTPWQRGDYPLRAGVSSFGIGGTNAHVVLEEYQETKAKACTRAHNLVTLSAKTELALAQMTSNLREYLAKNQDQNLADMAYTLQVGRKDFPYRRAFVATTIADAMAKLPTLTTHVALETNHDLVFMFPGQGAQYINLGRELYESHSLFKAEMDRCFLLLEFDLSEIMFPDEQGMEKAQLKINEIRVIGPLLFTIEYALAKLLMSWGLIPQTLIGYSAGEYVAACLAGVFSLEDALKIVAIRGELLSELPAGAMISAPLSEGDLHPFLNEDLSLSVANGDSCIVSGSQEAINDFEARLKKHKLMCMRLNHLHIAHSQAVDPILDRFRKELEAITLTKPHIKYVSGLTGKPVQDGEVTTADYWTRHLRETVRFTWGIETLLQEGNYTFIEVGPGRDLSILLNRYKAQCPDVATFQTLPPKNKQRSAECYLFSQIGKLWCHGVKINWESFNQGLSLRRVPLPTYPFAATLFDTSVSSGLVKRVETNEKAVSEPTPVMVQDRSQQITNYQEPANETEKVIIEIMKNIFMVDLISVDEDFFDLGGDSLKATILAGKIHEKLNSEIAVHEIFDHPTAAAMANLIGETEKSIYTPIEVAPTKGYYPLTPQQKGIFIADVLGSSGISYNITMSRSIDGHLQREKVAQVFKQIVKRHDSLRTGFKTRDGEIVQYVAAEVDFKVDYFEGSKEDVMKIKQAFVRPFDLSVAPLFRVALIELAADHHLLLLDIHHIVADGSSMAIIINEFIELYEGKELLPLKLQYKDYEHWQRKMRDGGKYESQAAYWLDVYREPLPILNLPTDYPRPAIKSFSGSTYHFQLNQSLTLELQELASLLNATLFMVLLTAYNILLTKYTGGEDIVVGSPFAGRTHGDLQGIVGMFVGTIALRNRPKPTTPVIEFLLEVRDNTLKAYENQDYQFEELVEKLNLRKDLSRSPIFDTMFVLQNAGSGKTPMKDITLATYGADDREVSLFDLTLSAYEKENGLAFTFEYATKLFKPATIDRLAKHLLKIIEVMVKLPTTKIGDLTMLSEAERDHLMYTFNQTELPFPANKTIQELFEAQVQRTPTKTALVFQNQELTYKQLNEKANQLARAIKQKNIKPGDIVAIMIKRSQEMIIAMLAVLKAGGVYVMIDSDYPQDRIKYMLRDSGVQMLVTKRSEYERANLDDEHELIDVTDPSWYQGDATNLAHTSGATDLMYVVYTSGTTGQPKGIMIEQQTMVNLVNFQYQQTAINFHERVMQFATMSFDVCYQEIFTTLLRGGTLYIIEDSRKQIVEQLLAFIEFNQINVAFIATAYFKLIAGFEEYLSQIPQCLDHLIVGGEQLIVSERVKKQLREQEICLHNHYGPSESHVVTTLTMHYWEQLPATAPIGKPIANHRIYLLGKDDELQPIGVPGELCIAGVGLARGYLNLPELTAAKFVSNPLNPRERIYRTGDLARFLPDGNIEYLGRIDHQVKIRGNRVELGEIESRLLELEAVKEAIVIAKEEQGGDKYLCAYVVATTEISSEELRQSLAATLPEYMIPSTFVLLQAMPLTANGKVDRSALPEVDSSFSRRPYVPPRNQTEAVLAKIWSEVLNQEQVGINDNFFELGGHSLKATLVITKIHKELNVEVPLRLLFQTPTIKELGEYLLNASTSMYAAIEPIPIKEFYPASSAQKRMWLLWQLDSASIGYNMPDVLIIDGKLSKSRLEAAFSRLIARHEVLRTAFAIVDGEICQRVAASVDFAIAYAEAPEAKIDDLIAAFIRPFVLDEFCLFRVSLVKTAPLRHYLLLDIHHIIADGVTLTILLREFAALYEGLELPNQRLQYKDFAQWQNKWLQSEKLLQQEEYWLAQFADEVPLLNLPLDYPRPAMQSFAGDSLSFQIDQELTEKLLLLSQNTETTLYMILLSAINILLFKYTTQEDIIIGSPIAGRPHVDLQNLMGIFVNTLVMRNYPMNTKSYEQFLHEVKETALRAYENQDYQFEELVDKLNLPRDLSRNPLFDVMFILQNMEAAQLEVEGLQFTPYTMRQAVVKFDLTFTAMETSRGISFVIQYSTSLFKRETIAALAAHLQRLLAVITVDKTINIGDIDLLTAAERQQLLFEFNQTDQEYPRGKTLHQLFEEQTAKTPAKIALVSANEEMSYQELNDKSNQLARKLREHGVTVDCLVGIMMEPSPLMIVSILAVLKAGGAYLPLDEDYPQERLSLMLADSGSKILLTWGHQLARTSFDGEVIDLTDGGIFRENAENLDRINSANDLAYVMYTSGSTGKPKGVMIEHQSVVNHLFAQGNHFKIHEDSRILLASSISFDVSVGQLFAALVNGASLYLTDKSLLVDKPKLSLFLKDHRITHLIYVVPSLLEGLSLEGMPHLKVVASAGDNCSPKLWQSLNLASHCEFSNLYGPTEATITVSSYSVTSTPTGATIPIGKPIANTKMYILSPNKTLVPIGVFGELYIGGTPLARGYLNRPQLTRSKFIPNPFVAGEQIYHTGDLARFLADGNMEFLGRIDQQVKLRGFRIELGEIESCLLELETVKEAIVIAKEKAGDKSLCAYVVADDEISVAALRRSLSERLPHYMIPSSLIQLPAIPLTANGKVDRQALPEADTLSERRRYMAPRNNTETVLAKIWGEVLNQEQVGINDNFFDLGGHSLKAALVITKIQQELKMAVPLKRLFQTPTIAQIGEYIINKASTGGEKNVDKT